MTTVGEVAARSDEELVTRKIDELLAAHPPTGRPRGVPGRPVRRRPGLHPLSGGLRRAGTLAASCNHWWPTGCARPDAPALGARNPIGYGMAAPTILTLGSEAQRAALPASSVHL